MIRCEEDIFYYTDLRHDDLLNFRQYNEQVMSRLLFWNVAAEST